MGKSIILVGKGKSVLKSSREYVDSFDEVAFINFPRVTGYEDYISNKCDYHFFPFIQGEPGYIFRQDNITFNNIKDYVDYDYYFNNQLKIKKIFNICNHKKENFFKYIKDLKIIKCDINFRRNRMDKKKYNFFPSSGILAFDYLIDKKYSKISLIGFDFYNFSTRDKNKIPSQSVNSQYYFLKEGDKDYTDKLKLGYNPHEPQKQVDFIINKIKENPHIKFEILTTYKKFPDLSNLTIL